MINIIKSNNKFVLFTLACLLVTIAVFSGCSKDAEGTGEGTDVGGADSDVQAGSGLITEARKGDEIVKAEITMEDGGVILLDLDKTIAPDTVDNFAKLAKEGFYDGLTFHRVIADFMIQGGDPEGTGMGGSDETIKGEFSSNGVDNPITHVKGVISMARSQDPDSASSQFFITNADATFLDGNYAAFGWVTSGIEEVDKISSVETGENDLPTTPVVIKNIKILG
ncbi:MAG: peptidylprolyl isomerase [Clostridiales Family XIII bacterium]|jgi:peptidyl-prolyl cis-trans isomerase B (cyclophilin B)|nr:peptidylprolyl isomerase [Clostridiales Family XIII bacterium]